MQRTEGIKLKSKSARSKSPLLGHRDKASLIDRGPGGHRYEKEISKSSKKDTKRTKTFEKDREALLLQIQALQAQLEEKVKFSNDQVSTLMEDRKVKSEEYEAQKQKDTERIQMLNDKLKNTQNLLYESTKDFLELKYETRLKERKWMNERDKIMQEMDYLKDQIDIRKHEYDLQVFMSVNNILKFFTFVSKFFIFSLFQQAVREH